MAALIKKSHYTGGRSSVYDINHYESDDDEESYKIAGNEEVLEISEGCADCVGHTPTEEYIMNINYILVVARNPE